LRRCEPFDLVLTDLFTPVFFPGGTH
jgi:hypothetical protein